jgi:hypothetical protein
VCRSTLTVRGERILDHPKPRFSSIRVASESPQNMESFMRRFPLRLAVAFLILCNTIASTQAAEDASIPAVLRDWRAWVLKDQEFRTCPFLATQMQPDANGYLCAWPGRLTLNAGAQTASFSVHWRVDAPSWIDLPGDEEHWPQGVTVNGQRAPVLAHDGTPALYQQPGSYEISGTIPWTSRPQSLRVPESIGLVALNIDGNAVAPVQREGGEITLGRAEVEAAEADSLELHVFRKLDDGVPAELETQLHLTVSGQAREETLGPTLPAGFEAIALEGDWPARLDNDGRLHVQVQPGSATLSLRARALAPLADAVARVPAAPWPKQEIWSYAPASRLRVTSATAAVAVDPRQAQVPEEWIALPAFALGDGDKLTVEQRSRGLAPDEANRLVLQREAWLDFDGGGWYARDFVRGTMVQGWRFDVAAPYTLERAEGPGARGAREPLLVTRGAKPELSGVEWRTPTVDLAAGSRIAGASTMPAAGWRERFDRIDATLHFPFGYKLLGAPGADQVAGSWISRWTLLDVFVAAIVALAAGRLLGIVGAIAAAAYLILGYHETGSPLWSLLFVLALALIVRVLPEGKLQHAAEWGRRFALLCLIVVSLPFLAAEVRYALYPQLEAADGAGYAYSVAGKVSNGPYLNADGLGEQQELDKSARDEGVVMMQAPPPPPAPAESAPVPAPQAMAGAGAPSSLVYRRMVPATKAKIQEAEKVREPSAAQSIDHYSQSTVMQTGTGEPHWNLGSVARLSWSGPVLPEQSVRLVIAPPWVVRPLRLLLAALLVWLGWGAFRATSTSPRLPRAAATVLPLAFLLGSLALGPNARAQSLPDDARLQQLRERLLEAPKCAPACASIAQMQVDAAGDTVTLVLDVAAGERLAVPLPSADKAAVLKSIKVDTANDPPLAHRDDGNGGWLALDRGVHRVELVYTAYADKLSWSFALKPARATFAGKGWTANGIDEDRLLAGTLSLARERNAGAPDKPAAGTEQQFAPYVTVARSLSLGLDWTVDTTVSRLSPAHGGFTLGIPLLTGEHVSRAGIKVQNADGKGATATAAFADDDSEVQWNSALDKGDTLSITAPPLTDRAEVWRILVSPTWHAEFSGVPAVGGEANENPRDYRAMEFHPLPGETLTIKITRPTPTQGAVRAIDMVALNSEAGQRSATQVLNLSMRASQGGEQTITLPKGAEVISVRRDNEVLNLRALDGKLSLPLKPGAQRFEVRFRDNSELGFVARTPLVALGLPAANVDLGLQLPADRWVLATWGPAVGPAVLYWGELVLMIAIAWALTRTRRAKLRFVDWLLLGLGFSTFSWGALIVVVAWLFAFAWRGRGEMPKGTTNFNVLQIALAVLTVFALLSLISAIPQGLLGQPDMHVVGNSSGAHALRWFADRSADALPQASAVSVPLWVYKVLMLAWALWLANALIGWLREAFAAWTKDGYWRSRPAPATTTAPVPSASTPSSPPTAPAPSGDAGKT